MRIALHWQILAAIGLGALAGFLCRSQGPLQSVNFLSACDLLGSLFTNALTMVAVPLVMASVISAVSQSGSGQALGRMGLKTVVLYLITTLAAVLVALTLVDFMTPGLVDGIPAGARMALQSPGTEMAAKLAGPTTGVMPMFLGIVPPNLFEAARQGNLLGVVFFSVLLGYCLTRISPDHARVAVGFFRALYEAMIHMTGLVMRLVPVGVFGLAARTVAVTGLHAARPLLAFSATVFLGLLLYATVLLPLLVRYVAGTSPRALFRAMVPALSTAFSTASSAAALPTSIDCVEKGAGVSSRVAGFVMSLGATLNHAGTALYECAAVLFLAQAYGMTLSPGQQLLIAAMALGTTMGMAAIPAASLVAITLILRTLSLPAEAIGVLLVFDRILDMCRTTANVFADACCAVMVAKLEGERAVGGLPRV